MIVYITMLLLSILFIFIGNKLQKKWQKVICYVLASLPFFLVSAFRYNLGTDYGRRYVYTYSEMLKGRSAEDLHLETGYFQIINICSLITHEFYIVFVVTSAIIIGLIMFTIFNKSKNPMLSVIIFLLGGFFFDSLNIMRQYLATSFIIFGYRFLTGQKRYWILYVLCVIVAASMHTTALIMLVLVLFPKKMLVSPIWVLPCAIVVLALNENLFNILPMLIENTRFSQYLTNQFAQGEVSVLFIAENLCFYLLMYYIYRKNKKIDNLQEEDKLFLNIQACALLVMVAGSCHMLFIRVALYFSVFQIISVPYYISKIPTEEVIKDIKKITFDKLDISRYAKFLQPTLNVLIVLCFMFAFTRTNILVNTNEVVPYKTILNKELKIK